MSYVEVKQALSPQQAECAIFFRPCIHPKRAVIDSYLKLKIDPRLRDSCLFKLSVGH